jgi:large subunit ribosomal protein L22
VTEALDMLEFMPKKGARTLHKLIKSAAANAVNNNNLSLDALYIERIEV